MKCQAHLLLEISTESEVPAKLFDFIEPANKDQSQSKTLTLFKHAVLTSAHQKRGQINTDSCKIFALARSIAL